MMADMEQLVYTMENSIKMQQRARAERRAEEAERAKREFMEKLMRAANSQAELDGMASKVKGTQDAVQRDQLIGLIMAGF